MITWCLSAVSLAGYIFKYLVETCEVSHGRKKKKSILKKIK